MVPPVWDHVKSQGNAALAAGENEAAVQFYLQSYYIATNKYYVMQMVQKGVGKTSYSGSDAERQVFE
jgi:hypothetical protein